MLEVEKLQLTKVLIPKCGWITVHFQAESWLLLEVDDAGSIMCTGSHTQQSKEQVLNVKYLHWESLQGKSCGNDLFYLKKQIDLVN